MSWFIKFGRKTDDPDDDKTRRRLEIQERRAHALMLEVRRIDQALQAIRRELDREDPLDAG